MPTLVQINVCTGVLSTGKIVGDIGTLVSNKGWESYVAGRYDLCKPCAGSQVIEIASCFEKYFHFIFSYLFDKHGRFGIYSTKKLIKKIDKISPDLVHLHNIHGYYLHIGLLLSYLKKKRIPVVITTHDCWLITGHCAHFSKVGCDKWKTHCQNCPIIDSYPRSLTDNSYNNYKFKKQLFSGFDSLYIVSVSNWTKTVIEDSFLKHYPIVVIPNGVDTSVFHPLEYRSAPLLKESANKERILLAVSSAWSDEKGLSDYIRLNEVLPRGIKICLVGLNDSQVRQMPSSIICIKRTTNIDELVHLYNQADVVLSLSKGETFGLTVVEGFACGTPAIVYDNTALPELITPETGRVVKNGDIQELVNAIEDVLQKGKQSFSMQCRERAVSFYDKKKNYREYLSLYNSILERFDA